MERITYTSLCQRIHTHYVICKITLVSFVWKKIFREMSSDFQFPCLRWNLAKKKTIRKISAKKQPIFLSLSIAVKTYYSIPSANNLISPSCRHKCCVRFTQDRKLWLQFCQHLLATTSYKHLQRFPQTSKHSPFYTLQQPCWQSYMASRSL